MQPNRQGVPKCSGPAFPPPRGTQPALGRLPPPPHLFYSSFRRSPRRLLAHQRRGKDFSKLGMTHMFRECINMYLNRVSSNICYIVATGGLYSPLTPCQAASLLATILPIAAIIRQTRVRPPMMYHQLELGINAVHE